jgi:hypothetical protein
MRAGDCHAAHSRPDKIPTFVRRILPLPPFCSPLTRGELRGVNVGISAKESAQISYPALKIRINKETRWMIS